MVTLSANKRKCNLMSHYVTGGHIPNRMGSATSHGVSKLIFINFFISFNQSKMSQRRVDLPSGSLSWAVLTGQFSFFFFFSVNLVVVHEDLLNEVNFWMKLKKEKNGLWEESSLSTIINLATWITRIIQGGTKTPTFGIPIALAVDIIVVSVVAMERYYNTILRN